MENKKDKQKMESFLFYTQPGFENKYNFNKYDMIYLFANENVDDIIKPMNMNGKILSVTASADQMLNSVLKGGKDFTLFDINKFSKYFSELKINALKTLSYEEFLKMYNLNNYKSKIIRNLFKYKNLNKKELIKCLDNMDSNYVYFFQYLLELGFFNNKNNFNGYYYYNFKPFNNSYLDYDNYYDLKNKLKNTNIDYIDCDIFDLPKKLNDKKYKSMLFSNITSYMNTRQLTNLSILLKRLKDNIDDDGLIQIGYGNTKISNNNYGSNCLNRTFVNLHKNNIIENKVNEKTITYYKK